MDNHIFNISPIDNRYQEQTKELSEYLSDYGINKIRCEIEIKYFVMFLKKILMIDILLSERMFIEQYYKLFKGDYFLEIKDIEKKTNHDIKAIEYFIKDKLYDLNKVTNLLEYVHFGLTSQDINSLTNTLCLKRSLEDIIIPQLKEVNNTILFLSTRWNEIYMISKTHGQSAVTTSMGKELMVFHSRLSIQLTKLEEIKYTSKFGGAVGNLNAHYLCFPDMDWDQIMDDFLLEEFQITRNKYTTQVDHYDNLCEIFDIIRRINVILLDLNQDIWLYISNNYFKLKINDLETGSSTMPHKVNPINFENSEGNLHLANSFLNMFSNKLPISRLQRDLTDSTISRNFGSALGYSLLSYKSLLKGLDKLEINQQSIFQELDNNWAILMEPIQCLMKTENIKDAYEIIKTISRGKHISQETYLEIVSGLPLSSINKDKLANLTPYRYIGNLNKLHQ